MAEIVDLGAYGKDFTRDPYPYYAKLRAQGPIHRVRLPYDNDVWLVVGHQAVRAALSDSRLNKDWRAAMPQGDVGEESALFTNMLDADPPQHTRLRKLVAKEFTSRRVEALRPRVQQITDELLDDARSPGGPCRPGGGPRLPTAHDRHLRAARRPLHGPGGLPFLVERDRGADQ